ncbi:MULTISPECIES: VOC family protein [Bacillaceae]|uniref:VOC family protein n=1 Tax=Bacillaceae TaxID=186817 RepID=UPI001F343861|nr:MULTISPECIES: VOC family protein [Bacillaceae]
MIQGIFETHVHVRDLEAANEFYENQLGLKKVLTLTDRKVIFFEFPNQSQIFGIWEKTEEEWTRSHFAFEVNVSRLKSGITWLNNKGIEAVESFGLEPLEPIVHTWVPMASIYFKDPDGNSL